MKQILIINTGGTIGMSRGPNGFRPVPGYLQSQLERMPELEHESMPRLTVHEYEPVIDSSNMRTSDWNRLARDIQSNYESFDGFVILHGTDTMAYTSSALAFQLPQLGKPVILTGSQLPLGEIRNDARENLITAILLAADCGIPEVCILFGDSLLRGCRATKWSATRFDALDSPNYPPLATIGTNIDIHRRRVRATPDHAQSMPVLSIDPQEITTFRLFPGVAVDVLQNVLRRPLRALILESFGDGNGPTNHPQFIDSIREACDGGTVILNCSQCRHGRTSEMTERR